VTRRLRRQARSANVRVEEEKNEKVAPNQPLSEKRQPILSIEQEELRGISRTVAEIEWLLLILVLLYLSFGGPPAESEPAISSALFFYAAFVMSFRYTNFYRTETRWKIGIETGAMLVFITWVLLFTGRTASPLLNTYLLVVITSALTLGKTVTMIETVVIAACYVALDRATAGTAVPSLAEVGALAAGFAPVVLVAYVTTMFSADIRYGLNKAKLLSETDELTGLYNMRGFAIVADRSFGQALRYERPATVLMIDSDNLKTVNDTLGHEAGNELLRQLALCIQGELRYTDVSARYGGDEFIVLLPETPLKGALDVAGRIRRKVLDTPLTVRGTRVDSSVSIGVASFPADGRNLDAIVAQADRAMYQAKQEGKNRIISATLPAEGAHSAG
jgi:diguanylate cyclase (GGDEF)-like protein